MKLYQSIKKKWQLNLYLQIAIGRAGFVHHILAKMSPEVPEDNPENVRCEEWVHSQKLKKVKIKSRDHLTLTGYYLEHPDAKRIVLMFHGWRGGWDRDCASLAKGFYEKECSVLMVCQRAQGESQGKYIGFGVLERYDCLRWIRYMDAKTADLPMYLYGVSMGAATVLMASGAARIPDRVKGIIADCGYTSAYKMAEIFAEKFMKLPKEEVQDTVDDVNALCRKKAKYDFREYTTLDAMPKCKIPVFFVHGTADGFVPYEMGQENFKACSAKKTFLSVEGAEHAQSYITDPEKYMTALEEFFGW